MFETAGRADSASPLSPRLHRAVARRRCSSQKTFGFPTMQGEPAVLNMVQDVRI
jgi:hypothetical protein